MYKIPSDVKEKEKIIGGILNITQFLWLLVGLVLGLLLFIVSWLATGNLFVGIFFLLIGVGSSAPFAFKKMKDLSLFQYFKYKRQLLRRNRYLPNKKKERFK